MKIKKNKIFPYPVLSNMYDDYINCNFLLKVNAKKNRRKLVLAVEPVINCLTINNLLDEKKAKIVLHVECARTKHRQVFDLDKENFVLTNGCDEAINIVLSSYLSLQDSVLAFCPSFSMPKLYSKII